MGSLCKFRSNDAHHKVYGDWTAGGVVGAGSECIDMAYGNLNGWNTMVSHIYVFTFFSP